MTTTAPSTPSDSLFQRLKRVAPWFAGHPGALALGIVGILIGSATEPAIPALMKPLLDNGFDRGTLELWKIPAVLLLLFGVRGFAGFIAAQKHQVACLYKRHIGCSGHSHGGEGDIQCLEFVVNAHVGFLV